MAVESGHSDAPSKNFLALVSSFGQHESHLIAVARRLPNIAGQELSTLDVTDVGAVPLKAAFASYSADHPKDEIRRAHRAWDAFFSYLVAAGVLSESPMAAIAKRHHLGSRTRSFLESGLAKTAVVSILAPLMLLFVTERSKLASSIEQAQQERRRAARVETLKETKDVLQRLSDVSIALIYRESSGPLAAETVEDIRKRLRSEISRAEALFTAWQRDLPIISTDDINNFIEVLNAQVEGTDTVAYYLGLTGITAEEATTLRRQLDVITGSVRSTTHSIGLRMLDCLVDLGDQRENRPCGNDSVSAARAEIASTRERLEFLANELGLRRAAFLSSLPGIDTPEARAFRQKINEFLLAQAKDPSVYTTDKYRELGDALREVDQNRRLHSATVPYTKEHLANIVDLFQLWTEVAKVPPECVDYFAPAITVAPNYCLPKS